MLRTARRTVPCAARRRALGWRQPLPRCQLLRPGPAKMVPGRPGSLPPEPATRPTARRPSAAARSVRCTYDLYPALPPEPPTNPDSSSNDAQIVPGTPAAPQPAGLPRRSTGRAGPLQATPAATCARAGPPRGRADVSLACWLLLPDPRRFFAALHGPFVGALLASSRYARFFGAELGRYLAGIRLVDTRGHPGRALHEPSSLVSALVFMGGFGLPVRSLRPDPPTGTTTPVFSPPRTQMPGAWQNTSFPKGCPRRRWRGARTGPRRRARTALLEQSQIAEAGLLRRCRSPGLQARQLGGAEVEPKLRSSLPVADKLCAVPMSLGDTCTCAILQQRAGKWASSRAKVALWVALEARVRQ